MLQCHKDHAKQPHKHPPLADTHSLSLYSVTRMARPPNASYALLWSRYLLLPFLQGTPPHHAQDLPLLNLPRNPANTTPFLSVLRPLLHNIHVSHKAMPNLPTCPVPLIFANDNWQQVHAMLYARHVTPRLMRLLTGFFIPSVHFVGSFLQGRRGVTALFFVALCVYIFFYDFLDSFSKERHKPHSAAWLST